jgi:type I restriction enzyme, S subunit
MSGDVKPGYKQTEVGVIPEDWEVKPLKKISPAQSVGLVINPSSYFDDNGTLPMLVGSNISENKINWESAKRISVESNNSIPASQLRAGDLVTVRVGAPGITAVVPPELDGCNCASVMIVRQHQTFHSHWLCYVMNSRVGLAQIEHVQYGTAQKQFNISDAINFSYPFPSFPEQEAIAEALSDADALIESLTQLIAKKRQIKQGAMQELLTGKRRLHGFANVTSGYKQTEVGLIPEDWAIRKLGTLLAEPPTYGINAPAISYDTRYPTYLRITDISDDGRFIEESKASVSHPEAGKYILNAGDLVLARTGASVGKSYLCIPTDGVLVFAGFLIRVRPNDEKLSSSYLKFYTQSRVYWNWVTVNSMRSGQPGINGQEYAVLPIPIPSTRVEQDAIAEVLSEMDAEITALETKLAKARQLKQGMMHNLLTGRIRLV